MTKTALAAALLCSTAAFTPLAAAQDQPAADQQSAAQQAAPDQPAGQQTGAQPAASEQQSGKTTLAVTQLFRFNSSKLGTAPHPELDQVVSALQADPSIKEVDIIGYTDRAGTEKNNLALSLNRAEAVRDYLASKGIERSRLVPIGRGEAMPVANCSDKQRSHLITCGTPNRRVEIEPITKDRQAGTAGVTWNS